MYAYNGAFPKYGFAVLLFQKRPGSIVIAVSIICYNYIIIIILMLHKNYVKILVKFNSKLCLFFFVAVKDFVYISLFFIFCKQAYYRYGYKSGYHGYCAPIDW